MTHLRQDKKFNQTIRGLREPNLKWSKLDHCYGFSTTLGERKFIISHGYDGGVTKHYVSGSIVERGPLEVFRLEVFRGSSVVDSYESTYHTTDSLTEIEMLFKQLQRN